MSSRRRSPVRGLQLLLLCSLIGVLLIVGLMVSVLLGPRWALGYAAVSLPLLVVAGVTARRRARDAATKDAAAKDGAGSAGRSCTCCTTSQHDPVRIL